MERGEEGADLIFTGGNGEKQRKERIMDQWIIFFEDGTHTEVLATRPEEAAELANALPHAESFVVIGIVRRDWLLRIKGAA